MSHSGIPGPIGLSSKDGAQYTPYELGWNAASRDAHPSIGGLTLENLESNGWIDGYLAYIRAYLETERMELRQSYNRLAAVRSEQT